MFTSWRFRVSVLLLLIAQGVHAAAPAVVGSFDKTTWALMAQSLSRPSVVVFTTTDCAFCPDVIDELAREVRRKGKPQAKLFVVVMDGAGQSAALLANEHYRRADGLYAFNGQDLALRYSVNPEWRGLTPYVAMIASNGAVRFSTGQPSGKEMEALLSTR